MKFKIDENLPVEVAEILRGVGHDAVTVGDQGLGGADDTKLTQVCNDEHRAIITLDLDFSDIRTLSSSRSYRFDCPQTQTTG